ncbi:MAG: chromosome segregation protein SMC [Acidobacteria bacterium]|nr:MAG: chromosome segregation protein SMC [Acidobacteriota bacterium]
MRLDSVEIVGFKSFCDRQELSFRGGVTGIVGPNGCGKSNISDAISWVLGEQSVKSLRGTAMEDVIFAGSQSRQPLAMAEVNLKVSGLNGSSPDGVPECVVTRRLYRNGESEYLMNGKVCRLRDIHELFMDTGLGSKAYSIIEQGKIGLILSSKPADRRALIEEAAGITKYRARRRQTALKLEAAQQNLLRVNDIVHEVEKQLEGLKRQASKARRYRVLRDEMVAVQRILFGRRFLELQEQSRGLAARVTEESGREQAVALALQTEEAHMEARRGALYDAEGMLEQARARLSELTLAVDRHQGRSGYCREQIEDTERRRAELGGEEEELRARVAPLDGELADRREDEVRLRTRLSQAEEEARRAEETAQSAAGRERREEDDQEAAREAQVVLLGRLAALQNARSSVAGNAERAAADLVKLAAELEETERDRARVESLRAEARGREESAEHLLAHLGAERQVAAERGAGARRQAAGHEREADALQSERDGLAGRQASLEEIVATHAAYDEGARALLARPAGIEVQGAVADTVETDSAHERAVEAFLGERLQAVLVVDGQQALQGVRFLEESGAGRAALLLLDAPRTAEDPRLAEIARREPLVRGRLSERYRVTGPHAAAIRAALPDALVVDRLEDALAVARAHGPLPCVTLAGETFDGAVAEGGRGGTGLLAPRREIREATARLAELERLLKQAHARVEADAAAARAAEDEAAILAERIHAAEKELVAVRHDLTAADEEAARLRRKAAVLDAERSQAEQERGRAAVRLAELEAALRAAEAERESGTARLASLGAAVAAARAATESAQAASSEARSVLAGLRERAAAVEADRCRLEDDRRELEARIAAGASRAAELVRRGEELAAERAASERLLALALADRDRLGGDTAAAEDRVREIRNELEGREQALKERRREHGMLRDALAELEVARARTGSDLDHLVRDCQQTAGTGAAEAAARLSDEDRAAEGSALEGRVQELREKLDRMGPVNVLAVEQARELEERHRFLTVQRQDLVDSIAEMDRAIKSIDRTSKERFREAFQVINRHFGEIFKQLFGGGTAGLSLLDEEDILESGIDVMAQPPGKRLQNVMLLSGGEKALTAISLLFAIFQYKPSPFCILDEVDAPLDDANIGRFVRMLEGLKDQTQFVLITHSRKTMEIADQLYGVTMEEPGVSKLVSVRFS